MNKTMKPSFTKTRNYPSFSQKSSNNVCFHPQTHQFFIESLKLRNVHKTKALPLFVFYGSSPISWL